MKAGQIQQDDGIPRKRGGRARLLPGLSVKDGYTKHPFDVEHGVQTSGLVAGRHLGIGQKTDRQITAYYGVAPSVFQSLLRRWQRSKPLAPRKDYTFVDIGAGMGRAMLLAVELPFREVVGVELHPMLAHTAQKNQAVWEMAGRAQSVMRVVCQDVLDFEFPASPCMAFLFNPFGPVVMRRLLAKMARSFAGREGQLDLLYVNHEQESILQRHPGFQCLFAGPVRRSRVDAIADHTIMANQPDGEYAASNYEDCSIWRWMGRTKREPGLDERTTKRES